MRQIWQSYQRRLINLSGNNRSLLLLRLAADQFIDLHSFDFLDLKPSFRIISDVIAQKPQIPLIPNTDSRDADSNRLAGKLKKLQRREQFIFHESGARDLYLGWPFVTGQFNEGTPVRAPLIFFPMSLRLKQNAWSLEPRGDVNISLNKSLILAYAHYNGVKVGEELVEHSFDDDDEDATAFRTRLYELLDDSVLEIKFSPEIFADKLQSFRTFKRKDFEAENQEGQLALSPEAVLGIFPQADSYLVPDYDFLLEANVWESLDHFLAEKVQENNPGEPQHFGPYRYFPDKVKEEETYTPFRLDTFQENAIKAVKKGNSLVVQGPPGTGKSQLICNLISDFIARGKKVLLVSQKRAALDVVYNRLKKHQITDFVALVHDFKNDRREIYAKIANQVERLNEYKQSNDHLDAIQLDRAFRQAGRTIDDLTERLDEYKTALYDESECGLSVKQLYLTSDPEQQAVSFTQEYGEFNFKSLAGFEKELERYLIYASQFNHPDYPWSDRVNFAPLKVSDLQLMLQYLDEIPKVTRELTEATSRVIGEAIDYDACRTMAENLKQLQCLGELLGTEEVFDHFKPMAGFQNKEADRLWLQNTHALINKCFDEAGVEQSTPAAEIGEVQLALKKRFDAKKTFYQSFKWHFSKEKVRLARVLAANGLRDDEAGLKLLAARIDNRLNLQHQLSKLKASAWIDILPKSNEQEIIDCWFEKMGTALEAKLIFDKFASFKEYFKNTNALAFGEKVRAICETLKDLPGQRVRWNQYILPRQIDLLLASEGFYKNLKKTIRKDFDAICDQDRIRSAFSEVEKRVVDKLEGLEGLAVADRLKVFDNSLRLAWIDHIENKYPVLRSVSSLQFDQLITDLQNAVAAKAALSVEILLQKAREKTYEPVAYNRLNNRVTYRDLQHQVTKQRMIWPLRRLLTHFSDELFHLMPCWMASPESVSAIFPMEQLFDLVVFDEASQCFAEKGLPAIYRGRQVVIAGDDQQLQPNDLYRVRWEEEEPDEMAMEVDSLLSLAKKYLMEADLRGHYRSQSPDLIDFSNRHFYKGRLQLLPHFDRVNDGEPGIAFCKVAGLWENQQNLPEAEEVVSILKRLLQKNPEKSMGVLTFNVAQQQLILDLLEEAAVEWPDDLFVKNIENVQGDERDIIIFSTAYGPDEKGKVVLQFGSLNMAGGENRLNVAITRAREKVVVVTSLEPAQLKVDHTKNKGPKLLKSYLEYAQKVSQKEFTPVFEKTSDFPRQWYLKSRLSEWDAHFPVRIAPELPFGDLTIKQKRKYLGLLLTDDEQFYNGLSIKETFVYKPCLLQQKKWKFNFFHSRGFWLDKQKVKDKIERLLGGICQIRT